MANQEIRDIVYNIMYGRDNIHRYEGEKKAKIYSAMYKLQRKLGDIVL